MTPQRLPPEVVLRIIAFAWPKDTFPHILDRATDLCAWSRISSDWKYACQQELNSRRTLTAALMYRWTLLKAEANPGLLPDSGIVPKLELGTPLCFHSVDKDTFLRTIRSFSEFLVELCITHMQWISWEILEQLSGTLWQSTHAIRGEGSTY